MFRSFGLNTKCVLTDLGRRTYYLEWGKLIFGSTWFGWVVAAGLAAVHFGPTWMPALPGAKAQPTMGELHALLVEQAGKAAYCAANIEQALTASKNPLAPPRVPAKK